MTVRRARPSDAAAVQKLYEALVPGDRNIRVDPARIERLALDPNNHLLVVENEGEVVGTVLLSICLDAMYGACPFAVIENIVVREATRGRGVGRALLEAVDDIARAARCTKVMLLSASQRAEAHGFFVAHGYDGERKRGFIKYINRPKSAPAIPTR